MAARRILIIDDEADIREVAHVSLELVGGSGVLAAGSGPEGLELARAERPDAILLDVMMPGMDGPATLRALKADPATCDIPVVFLTAKASSANQQEFEALGVTAVLAKPFDPLTLAAQLSAALKWAP